MSNAVSSRYWRDHNGYLAVWLDPDDTETLTVDWADRLASDETISTATWTGDGITVASGSTSGQRTTTTISASTRSYAEATCKITTSASRTLSRTVRVYEREG